ncbi:MAG: hypothetical protein ACXIUM_07395 [Wenzhouxiangella sp.]
MSIYGFYRSRSPVSSDDISAVENRLAQSLTTLSDDLNGIAHGARKKLLSPVSLLAAMLLGAAMHRSQQINSLRLLALLQAVNSGLGLFQASRTKYGSPGR